MARELTKRERAQRLWPSHTCRPHSTRFGSTLQPHNQAAEWQHPWQISVAHEDNEWRGYVNPGFVNGRPAFVHMDAKWLSTQVKNGDANPRDFGINPLTGEPYFSAWVFDHDKNSSGGSRVKGEGGPVRLTNSPQPYLTLADWRNPAASSTVTEDGRAAKAEGYPAFFEELGVVPASKGGPLASFGTTGDDFTGVRTRQIRAMDVVLRQPRSSTGLFVEPHNPLGTTSFLDFQTTYNAPPDTRSRLRAIQRYIPILGAPGETGPGTIPGIFGFILNQGDAQFDEMLMATVWMISPPNASEDDDPDGSWEPYVQHKVFWNLNWANKVQVVPDLSPKPIRLPLPLLGGVAQPLIDSFLGWINQGFSEAINFLAVELAARMSGGKFWTT